MSIAAIRNARTLLANCSAFQTWAGAANATAALSSIVRVADASPSRPFALLSAGDSESQGAEAGGATTHFALSGTVQLRFEWDIPDDYADDPRGAEIKFLNDLGEILNDLEDLAGTDSYLNVRQIVMSIPPTRSSEVEDAAGDDFYLAEFEMEWGP